MRELIAIISVLLLTACSTTSRPASTNRIAVFDSKTDDAVEWSEEQLTDYLTELTDAQLTEVCGGKRSIRTQRECVRDALYQGFDTVGVARERCDAVEDLEQFGRCVILGSLVYDTRARAGMPDDADFNWTAEDAELKELGSEVGAFLAEACLGRDLSAIERCMLDSFAHTFGAPPGISEACYRIERTEDAAHCLMRVSFVDRFETAVKRMRPSADESA